MSQAAVFINRIAAALPNAAVGNDDMEAVLGQVGGRPSRARRIVLRGNGIRARHYAIDSQTGKPNYTNAELTAEAIRGLTGDGFSLEDMSCLVCGTSMADQIMPNHAVMVQGELGNPPCEVVATSGICVSGITALKYAYMAILSGLHRQAVATGSELSSSLIRAENFNPEAETATSELGQHPSIAFEKDFLRWMLSDGAGAVLLSDRPNDTGLSIRINWIEVRSFANQLEPCMYAGAEKIDGKLVGWTRFSANERQRRSIMAVKQDVKLLNEHIVNISVEQTLKDILRTRPMKADDVHFFLPHYSSEYFRDKVHEGLSRIGFPIPYHRWFTNLATKGNMGAASPYIMLEELFHSGRLEPGQNLLCFIPESGRFSSAFLSLSVVSG
jgi:3-oxoacyl-[acyl-carrier-protein] synthase-3